MKYLIKNVNMVDVEKNEILTLSDQNSLHIPALKERMVMPSKRV